MKATIQNVVKKSGLSYVTVCKVINNAPNVREHNRRKVLETIKELGYVPNAAARSLVTGKTNVIAMFVSELGDDSLNSIVQTANELLLKKGYLLALCICNEKLEALNTAFLAQNRVDGVILLVPNKEKHYIGILKSQKMPFIVVDNQTIDNEISSVLSDNIKGGYIAAKHLIDLGHKSIGLIGANPKGLSTLERQKGALEALTEANLKPYAIEYGKYDHQTGYDNIMKWSKSGTMPTAVFAFDDCIAIGAINAAKDLGLKIPGNISVCGYDDSIMANSFSPKVTSVRQPAIEMAQNAVNQLLDIIDGISMKKLTIKISPEISIKQSTAYMEHL